MIDFGLIPDGGMAWLEASGPGSHLVVSTRMRLARNLERHRFAPRSDPAEREAILAEVQAAAAATPGLARAALFRMDQLEPADRQLLHERHLVSRELAALEPGGRLKAGGGLLVQDMASVMINEEDHLRLQALRSGFSLEATWELVETLDTELGQRLAFAFHPEFGYLTSCPTNVGTGLRASVLVHLPGLVLTKEINKILQALTQVGLTFRGLYGEGSEVVGNLFQLSNQTTLGKAEPELLDHLGKLVRQVMEHEERARQILLRDATAIIEDKVWRAYGLLRYARTLSFDETMNLLSGVRLGVGLGLLPNVGMYALNKLLVYTQPAHLAAAHGRALSEEELPVRRAAYVRQTLEEEVGRRGSSTGTPPT
ncbi:MAG TPA: protein arginine kinase [Gemmatimonadales bacterium]|jgi:protein arginine kinase|nr:protein arginine kinase [Gemmatimonadales bacterium]